MLKGTRNTLRSHPAPVLLIGCAGLLLAVPAAIASSGSSGSKGITATAELKGCSDDGISGTARLVQRPSDEGVKLVDVEISVKGMKPGQHAVHIHETASCDPCGSAGGHFDPGPMSMPSPDGNHPFHMGDLINLEVKADGTGSMKTTTSRITLTPGPLSLFDADGSAFIVHVDPDTYCPEGEAKGCAGGSRAACGIIKNASGEATSGMQSSTRPGQR